ncbi:MAG: hypothetical protein SPL99_07780 [Catonella sp.]|nr:hypothetical protein [Catonella sp.]MDY6357037.1 hypothetical protein [Catonella sp.]
MNKKTTLIGIVMIIAVAIITFGLQTIKTANKTETLTGYVGGEKIGFLEDEEVRDILAKKYHIVIDYKKAGSLDMVTADKEGMDFLWPSSQTALEMYQEEVGKPYRSEVIFNTPIVIYTRKMVKDALDKQGITYDKDGASYIDMKALTALIEDGKSWADIGLPDLYGQVEVATTDPTISLDENGGKLTDALLDKDLQKIAFEKHGFRTGNSGTADASAFDGIGIATTIKTVAPLPDYKVMDKLIKALSE